jgi:hypothetical protein
MQMQQQPQYFAAPQPSAQPQQQQQAAPASPAQANPPMPTAAPGQGAIPNQYQPAQDTTYANQPTTNTANTANNGATPSPPAPTADAANYDYLAEMQKMGQMYDVGGQYDLNQRSIEAEKARQQNMAAWAQNQLTGRGGTAAQAQQNYMNTMAALQADTARAQLAQGAHQTELGNRLAFNKQVADTKMQLVNMANELGYNLTDEQYNQIAYEIGNSYQGGRPVSPGEMLDMLKKGTHGQNASNVQQNRELQIGDWMSQGDPDNAKSIYNTFAEMSDEEFKKYGPEKVGQAIAFMQTNYPQRAKMLRERLFRLGMIK